MLTSFAYVIIPLIHTVLANQRVELNGAGASFPGEVYAKWIAEYMQYRRPYVTLQMTYDSVGTGAGKEWIKKNNSPYIAYAGADTLLTPEQAALHPDLRAIPTMAGAVVLAYNLPELENQGHTLILDNETIVSIYNGTIRNWNHALLQALNPNSSLPDADIIVVARKDKSGTTSAFTSGLASFSREWNKTYGMFSSGLDDDRRHRYWNESVIAYFGNTNKGMAGLLMSLWYSIGYIAIADAKDSTLACADIKNRAGSIVTANIETVEEVVRRSNTFGTVTNSDGRNAYPLVTLTYLIIRLTGMEDCLVATELARYIAFFFTNEAPRNRTKGLDMVPIDSDTRQFYMETVVHNMTCRGRNVWEMIKRQIEMEQQQDDDNSWKLPIYVGLPLLIFIIFLLIVLYGRQQYKTHSELFQDKWRIPFEEITPLNNLPSISARFREEAWRMDSRIGTGLFNDQPVILIRLEKNSVSTTMQTKRMMLLFRDKIKHRNIIHFWGMTAIKQTWYIVHAGETQGSVRNVLDRSSLSVSVNGLVALLKDILRGMRYLHREGVVHGHLTGSLCLLDSSWTVRISAWSENAITNGVQSDENSVIELNQGYRPGSNSILWDAPELVKRNCSPTFESDVYNFGMVVQEVFTRSDPFSELHMLPQEVVKAVITCSLRPQFNPETPVKLRPIMERCWSIDPVERPTFQTILELVEAEFPQETSILECMVESMRAYSDNLESKLEILNKEEASLKENVKTLLHDAAPKEMVQKFLDNQKIDTDTFADASVIAVRITNIPNLERHLTSQGVINMLNNFYSFVDQTIKPYNVYRIFRHGDEFLYGSGIPDRNSEHAQTALTVAMEILECVAKYNIEHFQGIEADVRVQIAVASGSLFAGVCGKLVPVFTVIGEPMTVARELSRLSSENGSILLSKATYHLLDDDSGMLVGEVEMDSRTSCYQLIIPRPKGH